MCYVASHMGGTKSTRDSPPDGNSKVGLVPPAGFEPTTVRLEGGCSIRLSYEGRRDALNYTEWEMGMVHA